MSTEKPLPPPPPSRGRDRELWVGALVIVGVASIFIALFTLTDARRCCAAGTRSRGRSGRDPSRR